MNTEKFLSVILSDHHDAILATSIFTKEHGVEITVNRSWFIGLSNRERIAVLSHECGHAVMMWERGVKS